MSETLKIRLAARCDAAGRPENEDNFHVAEDLSASNIGFTKDKIFPLGSKGTLLLVCDGMGGMNAGEVASAIGVETIKNLFSPQLLTSDVLNNDDSVCAYMKRAIVMADSQIKEDASKDDAKRGMGSTAVMAWLLGRKVYVAWCGDSRCYRYNPETGLEQLSHDHSYVQDLVDTGHLLPELAFDHPNKNIITRSLGDPRGAARPDTKVYDLHPGDVILLCSDGLSDSLRDSEIEQSISRSLSSMTICLDTLWNDSYQAGWHDNVTVVLAQVVNENEINNNLRSNPQSNSQVQAQPLQTKTVEQVVAKEQQQEIKHPPISFNIKWKSIFVVGIAVLLLIVIGVLIKKISNHGKPNPERPNIEVIKEKFNADMFSNLKPFTIRNIEDSIKSTNTQYNNYKELESDPKKINDAKETINTAIDHAAGLYESNNPDSLDPTDLEKKANEIREMIIK